jgi:hypothetical protein
MRSFDPVRLGGFEATVWVAYYQRRWGEFLRSAIGLVREGFGMPWPRTLRGAWLVLRANQAWAPFPNNDPDRARELMREFYTLVTRTHGERFDEAEAARLEVEWWRVHRYVQHEADSYDALAGALAALYVHVYGVPADAVAEAAARRAEAMRISDEWVAAGSPVPSPAIAAEREELVKGYALLLAAVRV